MASFGGFAALPLTIKWPDTRWWGGISRGWFAGVTKKLLQLSTESVGLLMSIKKVGNLATGQNHDRGEEPRRKEP
jgi:hypothetical protein